jgi:hypothetical protein
VLQQKVIPMRKRIRIQPLSTGSISIERATFEVEIFQSVSRILGQKWLGQGNDKAGHYWDVSLSEEELASALDAITILLKQSNISFILPVLVEERNDFLERISSKFRVTNRTQTHRHPLSASPPNYLKGVAIKIHDSGPAHLLFTGGWCGHGESNFAVFDIVVESEKAFSVQLPVSDDEGLNPPLVMINSDSGLAYVIYDSRKHPASIYYTNDESEASSLQATFHCPNCDKEKFNISVGFEIPGDAENPNDTSWFVLAAKCVACQWEDIIYDDETA